MMALFGSQELLEIVKDGFQEPENEATLNTQELAELKSNRKKDCKAKYFIMQTVEEDRISKPRRPKKLGIF